MTNDISPPDDLLRSRVDDSKCDMMRIIEDLARLQDTPEGRLLARDGAEVTLAVLCERARKVLGKER